MRRALRAAAWLVLIVLGALGPVYLASVPTAREEMVARKYASWTGVLRLWTCEGWQAGKGNLQAWLNEGIAAFEKAHPGAYIQATAVSEETMRAFEVSAANPPDMILFAPGMLEAPYSLMELEGDFPVRSTLREAGMWGDGLYAVPVAMGGYAMAVNSRLLPETPGDWAALSADDMPEGGAILNAPADGAYTSWSAALLHLFAGNVAAAEGTGGYTGPGIDLGLSVIEEEEKAAPEQTPENVKKNALPAVPGEAFRSGGSVYQAFTAGKIMAMPVAQREIMNLSNRSASGKGVDWRAEVMGRPFTDQIAYLAVTACPKKDLSARQALCVQLIRLLLSESVQRKLTLSGAFPVAETAGLYQGVYGMDVLESILLSDDLACAPAFGGAWREYARCLMDALQPGGETAEAADLLREMLCTP